MYSIKVIASLTGLGTETLRAWERRYQTIVPNRNENGKRFYSEQDLQKLKLLADLTRQGHSISKISNLNKDDLENLLANKQSHVEKPQLFSEQIVEALLNYRMDRCEQLLKRALLAHEPLSYVRDILVPTLRQVGQLWHDEILSVAQEHLFSACVKRILLGMINNLHSISANRPNILFATPSGEPHEFALLMCCLLAAEQQYNCYYLGINAPAVDILEAADKLKCQIVVLSLLKCPMDNDTQNELQRVLSEVNSHKTILWLGGDGVHNWAKQQDSLPDHIEIIDDFDGFYSTAQRYRFR